jgi:hypothetical protein
MKIIPLLFALLIIGMYAAPVMAADPSNELTDPISYLYKWFGGKRVTTIDESTFGNVTNIFNNSGNLSTISTYTNFYNIYQSEMNQTPGPQGEPGEPAAIYVNFTFQREPGEDAYVADVGTTPYEAELDFYIPRGYNGTIGETGPQGEPGPQGIPGLANMTAGPQGEKGDKGDQGDIGPVGPMGPMNQTANMTAGPQGDKGDKGDTGNAATVGVNNTVTGAPGTSATVTNIGTAYAALFDFVIPRGPQGEKGETGTNGEDGTNGTNGEDGEDGAPGNAATVGVNNTVTGAPGTSATVTNIGTAYAALFDFVIPRGEKGDKGDTGDTGPMGPMNQTANMTAGPQGEPGQDATIEDVYPVGSIYISTVSTNPNTLFGFGTWAAFGTGRVLVGIDSGNTQFDVVEETGGSNVSSSVVTHTHTATVTDAGHNHLQTKNSATTGAVTGYGVDTSTSTQINSGYYTASNTTGITVTNANPAGSVSSFSIMNPYIVVYMWERTA